MRRIWWVVLGVVVAGVVAGAVLLLLPKPVFSGEIRRQVTSAILVPVGSEFVVDRTSAVYSDNAKLLTYVVRGFGKKITVSEQPSPENFTSTPKDYDDLLRQLNEYKKFEAELGTVHLAKPVDLAHKQMGVLNTKGTLMFVKPADDLSDDKWRKLFNAIQIVR